VRASVSASKFSMRLRIKLLISEGLSFICFSLNFYKSVIKPAHWPAR
jgi:hypothetical protein